ncbi:MAG: hypothetical protein IJD16_10350 [Desulfovibrio sp.]|nr:hypothetical protein [Desulfovibrio sp.]
MTGENLAQVYEPASLGQQALEKFSLLLEGLDFHEEMEILGIGRMQFMRRRQMTVELRGLYMGLWRLALGSSFPQDADTIFALYLQRYALTHPDRVSAKVLERAQEYWSMLQASGLADFSHVARHICAFSSLEEKDSRAMTLRLVLHFRAVYKMIFDRLI